MRGQIRPRASINVSTATVDCNFVKIEQSIPTTLNLICQISRILDRVDRQWNVAFPANTKTKGKLALFTLLKLVKI